MAVSSNPSQVVTSSTTKYSPMILLWHLPYNPNVFRCSLRILCTCCKMHANQVVPTPTHHETISMMPLQSVSAQWVVATFRLSVAFQTHRAAAFQRPPNTIQATWVCPMWAHWANRLLRHITFYILLYTSSYIFLPDRHLQYVLETHAWRHFKTYLVCCEVDSSIQELARWKPKNRLFEDLQSLNLCFRSISRTASWWPSRVYWQDR
jgi:hypothetical protein